MKKSSLVFLIASCILFAGCRYSSSSGKRLVKPEEEDIENVEDDEPEMDDAFYVALLDAFCQKHYDKKLKGSFICNSIHDITVVRDDANTVKVEGKHSFKGKVGDLHPYENRLFWATVHQEDRNTFVINFSRDEANPLENIPGTDFIPLDRIETGDIPFEFFYEK